MSRFDFRRDFGPPAGEIGEAGFGPRVVNDPDNLLSSLDAKTDKSNVAPVVGNLKHGWRAEVVLRIDVGFVLIAL